MSTTPSPLILASTSSYRKAQLERLGLAFEAIKPEVEETPEAGESPRALAKRLARAKSMAVAGRHPGAVVIGGDQVAEFNGTVLGKPGTLERAHAQLTQCSGQTVQFFSALCVVRVDAATLTPEVRAHLDHTRVRFRRLSERDITRYLEREAVLDCAGSFKSEGLGITLFENIESSDPTALIGLPLIWTASILRSFGFELP
jgi:septum formation protein